MKVRMAERGVAIAAPQELDGEADQRTATQLVATGQSGGPPKPISLPSGSWKVTLRTPLS